jgi:segregation and condensation protein B
MPEPETETDPDIEHGAEAPEQEQETSVVADAAPTPVVMDHAQLMRLLEAMLFAAAEPLTFEAITARLPKDADAMKLIDDVEALYADRGVNLFRVAGKFTLRTAPDLVDALKIERTVRRKLSRAAIETMAIIAYHQPVTRAEVEEIRGVELSRGTLDVLMEAGWIQPRGHRETPGRPALWVTTEQFLLHFGLDKLDDLPGVEDLKAAGLLDARPTVNAYAEEAGLTFTGSPEDADEEQEEPAVLSDEESETPDSPSDKPTTPPTE